MKWLPILEIRFESNFVNFFLGLTEYDSSPMSATIQVYKISDNRIPMIIRTIQGQMLHGLGGTYLRILDQIHKFTIRREILPGEVEHPRRDCCRKQQILGFLRSMLFYIFEHFLDVLLKPLLQHLICLIKASYLQLRQVDNTPLKQVQQSPRS